MNEAPNTSPVRTYSLGWVVAAAMGGLFGGYVLFHEPAAPPPSNQALEAPAQAPAAQGPSVWVNTASGVYHYPGHRWYGRTSVGTYMTEAEAQAKGYRPSHSRN